MELTSLARSQGVALCAQWTRLCWQGVGELLHPGKVPRTFALLHFCNKSKGYDSRDGSSDCTCSCALRRKCKVSRQAWAFPS